MLSINQQTIKQQCASFHVLEACFSTCWFTQEGEARVLVACNNKAYNFSDPDLNVIIMQLAHLYKRIKIEHNERYIDLPG